MNWLTRQRARRPLNARVIAVVKRGSTRAASCTGLAPLSGQRRKAVPNWAAAAPAARTAATPRGPAMPYRP